MRDLIEILKAAGFTNVECVAKTGIATSQHTLGATFRARKPGLDDVNGRDAG